MIAMPNGSRPEVGVKESVNALTGDCGTLLELQGQLFQIELAEWVSGVRRPVAALVGGAMFAVAAVLFLLSSCAASLYLNAKMSLPAALASVGGVALLAAVCLGAVAWRGVKATEAPLPRSRHELRRNLEWLASAVTTSVSRDRPRT